MSHRIVGQSIGRVDGADKVSGAARFSADVTLPGLVWGKALRSPLPHARILEHLGLWAPLATERSPPLVPASWPRHANPPLTYHPVPDIA